jgi:hypothetical protein
MTATSRPARPLDAATALTHLQAVSAALAGPGGPEECFVALDKALGGTVGHKSFTILALNEEAGENRRCYSSRPEVYPAGGTKPIQRDAAYYQDVIAGGRFRFVQDRAGTIQGFADHALILGMGCESTVNIPVRWHGRSWGSLNLSHEAYWYQEADIPLFSTFAALAVPALLDVIRRWPDAPH